MRLIDANPYLRFAGQMAYDSPKHTVFVYDCRLFYILGGTVEISFPNEKYELKKNSVFYCAGGEIYTIQTIEPSSLITLNFDLTQRKSSITMPFAPENIETAAGKEPVDACTVEDSDFLNSHFYASDCIELRSDFFDIVRECGSRRALSREACSAKLKSLLIELHRKRCTDGAGAYETIKRVMRHISENYGEELKNSELAYLTGYHEYHLNRLFIRHTGLSMHKYIINIRVNEAKKLLLNTDMTLNTIAIGVGFGGGSHFSSCFKKQTGMSPSEYREKFKNKI